MVPSCNVCTLVLKLVQVRHHLEIIEEPPEIYAQVSNLSDVHHVSAAYSAATKMRLEVRLLSLLIWAHANH